jgi:hypothetical protein
MSYDPNEHVKTVYAHFGLAAYLAQVLEHGLVNALVFVDLVPNKSYQIKSKKEWEHEVDSFMDRHFEHSLGKMIRDLQAVVSVPEDLESLLAEALKRRNYLAHHFFRERAPEFMTTKGRDTMVGELREAQELFRQADQRLGEAIRPMRERYGVTDERLEQLYQELLTEIGSGP